ncbi:MAG: 3-hydroxyacyl-CoA dehydrogenase family protein [Flavisolibacter sp.]
MMNSICICGSGTMGTGIAQVSASAGYKTILYDLNDEILQQAKMKLEKDLQQLVEKQKISSEKRMDILKQIKYVSDITECTADLVIEAIIEKPEAKISLFNQLSKFNTEATIFVSNTSSISISSIAEKINSPHRVAGLHFFNPAPVMKLVEVVKAEQTSDQVIKDLISITEKLNKTPVVCKDSPGFIVNRVARPFYIESLRLIEEGVADFETIDRLLEGIGFKMGPFRLMDLIGNDINYTVSCSVFEQLKQPSRLKPSAIQKQKVDKGELGKKTGRGYYNYTNSL